MKTDILINGSMVKNHISLKTGFGYNAIRRTSFLLWYQVCQAHLLDHHRPQRHLQDRRVIILHLPQARLLHQQHQATGRFEKERIKVELIPLPKPTKFQNQIKKRPRLNGETRAILRFRNGCKKSGRIWWMMKFHYREALTPVHLMKLL